MLKVSLRKREDGTWEPLQATCPDGSAATLTIVSTSPQVVRLEIEAPTGIRFVRQSLIDRRNHHG
jgi:hypothetical protein